MRFEYLISEKGKLVRGMERMSRFCQGLYILASVQGQGLREEGRGCLWGGDSPALPSLTPPPPRTESMCTPVNFCITSPSQGKECCDHPSCSIIGNPQLFSLGYPLHLRDEFSHTIVANFSKSRSKEVSSSLRRRDATHTTRVFVSKVEQSCVTKMKKVSTWSHFTLDRVASGLCLEDPARVEVSNTQCED